MSLKALTEAAAKHSEDYVTVTASQLFAACQESDSPAVPGLMTLLDLKKTAEETPLRKISIHRTAHLGKLVGEKAPEVVTPAASAIES